MKKREPVVPGARFNRFAHLNFGCLLLLEAAGVLPAIRAVSSPLAVRRLRNNFQSFLPTVEYVPGIDKILHIRL